MRTFIDSLKARKAAASEGGFSLIDVVVTVAIIVALSVGGFIAYTGLVDSAKNAALDGAADQIRTAITVANNDSDAATDAASVVLAFNNSTGELTAVYTPAAGADPASVTVTNRDNPAKSKTLRVG